ncbi:transglutaminase-like domain-containing protein [Dactylosporangium sp. CS-033363]|uniref:transglutaminase-like domain-containing protein n=1 Tax=Dactylosporangium sp. CS-033363 TaxID=3239935 RepID=UPI003D8B3374
MEELEFYRQQSVITDPGEVAGLPTDPADLATLVGGVLIHRDWAWKFGVDLPEPRRAEAELRYVKAMLSHLGSLEPRPPAERLAVTCRDFAVLLVALLRAVGVPARARAGFAGYFVPGFYDDHWVVETWSADRGWYLLDAQVASAPPGAYGTGDLDPLDIPRDAFLVAGQAWMECRAGQRDPQTVGTSAADLTGFWEIQGNVIRDLAALTGTEVLPWDNWGLIPTHYDNLPAEDVALLDTVAPVSAAGGPLLVARETLALDARLEPPPFMVEPAQPAI